MNSPDFDWNKKIKIVIEKGVRLKIEEFIPGESYPHDSNLGEVWKVFNTYWKKEVESDTFPFIFAHWKDYDGMKYYFSCCLLDNDSYFSYDVRLKFENEEIDPYHYIPQKKELVDLFDKVF